MMLMMLTDAVISKGYGNAPTIRYFDDGDGAGFRVGVSVYDKNAENSTRWVNLNVIVSGKLTEQIRRMKLQEYSHINIVGTFDMRPSVNTETGEIKAWPTVRPFKIEFATSASGKSRTDVGNDAHHEARPEKTPTSPDRMSNFTGYEPLGGSNPFYGE